MPKLIKVYRTYKKDDSEASTTEEHTMLLFDAKEAVKNGQGEWSMMAPKGSSPEEIESNLDPKPKRLRK